MFLRLSKSSIITMPVRCVIALMCLQVFVHVSTSYCHLDEKILFEKAYPPPADPHKIIQSMELLEDSFVDTISKQYKI